LLAARVGAGAETAEVRKYLSVPGFDWSCAGGSPFRVCHMPRLEAAAAGAQSLAARRLGAITKLAGAAEYRGKPTIYIFVFDSARSLGRMLNVSAYGASEPKDHAIFVVAGHFDVLAHELSHEVLASLWGPSEPWIAEGFAEYASGASNADARVRELMADGSYVPLAEMAHGEWSAAQSPAKAMYPELGSFIEFLHRRYGIERLRSVWSGGSASIARVYGKPLEQLEREWHASLRRSASGGKRYDLGGPCVDAAGPLPMAKAAEAKKRGAWSEVIELQKASVRASCRNEYRWHELVSALLAAGRRSEAVRVLQEMDARGFDLNPGVIGRMHADVGEFMATPLFRGSAAGAKIERLKKVSDERRAAAREALTRLGPEERPPENYVAKGACPFECCRFGEWRVVENTELVEAPGSERVVGRARKGTRVTAVTGEVHLRPAPVVVLQDGEMPSGSIAFVLDYLGEGMAHVYSRGKTLDVFTEVEDYCFRVSDACWGERLETGERAAPVWWVKVRLADGVVGWTTKVDHFDGKDGCG
jgi:pentatricopeptide repeat protein